MKIDCHIEPKIAFRKNVMMPALLPRIRPLAGCLALGLAQTLLTAPLAADLAIVSPGDGGVEANTGHVNTYGWVFTVGATDLQVTGLGIWDAGLDGLNSEHPVAIWNSLGALLSSTTVEAGVAAPLSGEFRIESLLSPLRLSAGQTYTIGALYQGEDTYHGALAGDPTISPDISAVEGRLDFEPSLTQPTFVIQPGNPPFTGPNFEYNVVPEPGTWALLIAGGALLLTRRVTKRKP